MRSRRVGPGARARRPGVLVGTPEEPAGGGVVQRDVVEDELSARLVRLPLWTAMGEPEAERVIEAVREAVSMR